MKRLRQETAETSRPKGGDQLPSTDTSVEESTLSPHTLRLIRLIREGTFEHAKLATDQLSSTARQLSPLQLWNCLGVLQEALWDDSTQCRINAGFALEGVAKCLPAADQQNFLTAQRNDVSGGNQYLTVKDVQDSFHQILEQGQVLWATEGESRHGNEEETLDDDDLDERMRQQREILAGRLGLGTLQPVVGDCTGIDDSELVFREPDTIVRQPRKKLKAKEDSMPKSTSVRALLILAMSSSPSSASHQSPQRLLATELLFRMFHPNWTIRHGAMIGILALLKAWKSSLKAIESDSFGFWPHDLLARSLCMIQLDRLVDFKSSHAVAPCRALAGQLVAICLALAPKPVIIRTVDVLRCHSRVADVWEIRHGSLLAIQYICSVVSHHLFESSQNGNKDLVECLPLLEEISVEALSDCQDDVQSVSAQVLNELVVNGRVSNLSFCGILWKSLRTKPTVATGLSDLMSLTVSCLEFDSSMFLAQLDCGLDTIWKVLGNRLDAEFDDVRRGAVSAIGQVARSMDFDLVSDENLRRQVSIVVEKLFGLYCGMSTIYDCGPISATWNEVAKYVKSDTALTEEVTGRLLFTFFIAGCPSADAAAAAAALSILAVENARLTQFAIRTALSSFSVSICEAACVLCRAIYRRSPAEVDTYHDLLLGCLASHPNCILISEKNSMALSDDASFQGVYRESFEQGVSMICTADPSIEAVGFLVYTIFRAAAVQRLGPSFLTGDPQKTDMRLIRLNATLAATIVEGRIPEKITPCVRALMTSLQNESESFRQIRTSRSLAHLLLQIQGDAALCQARQKILNTVCNTAASKRLSAASKVLETLVSKMQQHALQKALPYVWSRLHPVLTPVLNDVSVDLVSESLSLINSFCPGLSAGTLQTQKLVEAVVPSLLSISCTETKLSDQILLTLKRLCSVDSHLCLLHGLNAVSPHFKAPTTPERRKLASAQFLEELVSASGPALSRFVRSVLPMAMSLMTDPIRECARIANCVFAKAVQIAPLAPLNDTRGESCQADAVIEHLILGKPLPHCKLPAKIIRALGNNGVTLREYQMEGVSWLRFLHSMKLNGALCDAMGLGKTLQALVSIAMSHNEDSHAKSLIVCPSTLVGHWVAEINRFFGEDEIFRVLALTGTERCRIQLWSGQSQLRNLVVTSYSVLRSDIACLSKVEWNHCVLDEGHLLKNPKTATAVAAKKLICFHRLILSGTPVQNKVDELWSAFDFLMPNFLGSSRFFSNEFSRAIAKGQAAGASVEALSESMSKLKILHQQVLPFILRREKHQVLRELPEKTITIVKIPLSNLQREIAAGFWAGRDIQQSVRALEALIGNEAGPKHQKNAPPNVLKSLLFLRLLCTHPMLIKSALKTNVESDCWYRLGASGKLLALAGLLRDSGIVTGNGLSAADDDTSLLYCDEDEGNCSIDDTFGEKVSPLVSQPPAPPDHQSKCLVFAQFSRSLDIIEELLFKPHMPDLKYLRLDGKVSPCKRYEMATTFNENPNVRVMLISTRVGSLGLNLTGADTVIFLEHDYNPFSDLQAMDRAHRIGQKRAVNVYRLVCEDSIEENIVDIQKKKVAMSNAIVNTENSSMYSLGTERLLDIFTSRSEREAQTDRSAATIFDLDNLLDEDEEDYSNLRVADFVETFKTN